jgi:hypothetical protein
VTNETPAVISGLETVRIDQSVLTLTWGHNKSPKFRYDKQVFFASEQTYRDASQCTKRRSKGRCRADRAASGWLRAARGEARAAWRAGKSMLAGARGRGPAGGEARSEATVSKEEGPPRRA